ncbi:MAG: DUF87 domain-containing protein [Desulfobacteraceae bacterium]|nr:DUF87 domain-containing protein [Desulfobacteraceae bacterium]
MIWVRYTTADKFESRKWEQMVNLLAEKYKINAIEEEIVLPPPDEITAKGDIQIGRTRYLNQPPHEFGINFHELTRHVGIFGSTGSGKTTLAKNILRELTRNKIPFIVFDWETNFRDFVSENKDVKIFTIGAGTSPFYFNYFKMPDGLSYKEYVKNIIEVFNKAYIGGVGSDSVLLKVFDSAYRQHDVPTTQNALDILDDDMRGERLRGREMLWKQSSLRMLEFLSYGGTGDIFNVNDFYPIEKLLKDQVVFELGALASSNDKRFFVEMFTLWYWLYKEQQGIEDEKLKHVLVFEEFHNIVDNSGKEDLIQKIFRQIRKYGTGLIIIDQTPSLIPNPIFENIYSKITFSLNHKRNVSAIADAMFMDYGQTKYIGLLETGQAICRLMGRYNHPFLIDIPFSKSAQNIPDEVICEHMADFYKDYSPEKPQLIEIEPLQVPPKAFTPSPLERIFLEDLLNNPFVGVDKRAKRLGLVPRDSTIMQNRLIENKIIRPAVIDRKKLFELTQQGEKIIAELGLKIKKDKNQSIEHRYYIEKIKQLLEKGGWTVFKEKSDLDLVGQMDDKTVAIEVETGKNNTDQIEKNIAKLVDFAAADRFILTTNESATIKIQNLISKIGLSESLHLYPIKEFIKNPPI